MNDEKEVIDMILRYQRSPFYKGREQEQSSNNNSKYEFIQEQLKAMGVVPSDSKANAMREASKRVIRLDRANRQERKEKLLGFIEGLEKGRQER